MTTTVKLPPELEHQLRQRSTQEGRSISELMRDALSAYLQNVPPPRASAFSLGADLFGRHAGPADLSTERRHHNRFLSGNFGHDVLSELDDDRQHILMSYIKDKVQTILTTATIKGLKLHQLPHAEIFYISAGNISKGEHYDGTNASTPTV